MSKNKITEPNHLFMCHQTKGYKKEIALGNTTYIVESILAKSGPSKAECLERHVKKKIGEIQDEKDTHPI